MARLAKALQVVIINRVAIAAELHIPGIMGIDGLNMINIGSRC